MGQSEQVPRSAVMSDVARLAGVSHQTVSRVLHDSPRVRPETRARVEAAMKTLDYRPNTVARALVTGRTRTLGVISFDTTLHGPASTLLGIERAAHDADYFIIVASLRSFTHEAVLGAVDRLRDRGVDGIVMIAPQDTAVEALRDLPERPPVVVAEAGPDALSIAEVDQRQGAARATQHLLELGHRTVWHIAGPPDWGEARRRVAGWEEALRAAGAVVPRPLAGDWSARSGYALGGQLIDAEDITAIFVANDHMALGLLRALHERGRRIPQDISVVGFDDIPETASFLPPLTTVHQDFPEVGRRCVDGVLRQIRNNQEETGTTLVPTRLVVRQ